MAKKVDKAEIVEKVVKPVAKAIIRHYFLKSRANYIIEVIEDGVHKFIQPFGKIKVIKEKLKLVNEKDAKFLTFIK